MSHWQPSHKVAILHGISWGILPTSAKTLHFTDWRSEDKATMTRTWEMSIQGNPLGNPLGKHRSFPGKRSAGWTISSAFAGFKGPTVSRSALRWSPSRLRRMISCWEAYHPIATSKGVRINDFKKDNCMKLAIDWGRTPPLTKFWPSISCAWLAPARSNESPSWVMPSRSFKLFSNLQRLQKFRNGCGNSCDFDWFCRFTSRFQEIWHWAGEKLKNLVYMRFCVRLFKLQWMEWSTRF